MRLNLANRVALVTGAGSGIGRAVALALAAEGVHAYCADLHLPAAESTVAGGDGSARLTALALDVRDPASAAAAAARVQKEAGHLDILVNSAGILKTGGIQNMSPRDWAEVERVNLAGTLYCAQAVIPGMAARRRGRIINIASVSAFRGGGALGNTLYGVTKAGVVALTMGLARELGPFAITVNAIAPVVTVTGMTRAHVDAGQEDDIRRRIPLGRLATPDDSAALAVFLASDAASFITGTTIPVDGGFLTL